MRPLITRHLIFVTVVAICFSNGLLAVSNALSESAPAMPLQLYKSRQSDSDLEVTGLIAALSPGENGYVRYADLLKLPQTSFQLQNDEGFSDLKPKQQVLITAVYLKDVVKALAASPTSDLVEADCIDTYRAHYPAGYIAAHDPLLALTMNRLSTSAWARKVQEPNPGPYFITHVHFIPAFHVLSHTDQPQVPTNVVRLNFTTTTATFGSIKPPREFAPKSPEQQGFIIASQNCLRCHNQGPYGGRKSGRNWQILSTLAREQPTYFASYVHNPKALDPKGEMRGNPQYDAMTLGAITAYFRTFVNPVLPSRSQ